MQTTRPLRWLHLTDLHVGKSNESQQTALKLLLTSIEKSAAGKSFDFVFLSGDLAFSGKVAEYNQLHEFLIEPLKNNPLFNNANFIGTPGNHDVDCDIGFQPSWTALGKSKQESFFHIGEPSRYRAKQMQSVRHH